MVVIWYFIDDGNMLVMLDCFGIGDDSVICIYLLFFFVGMLVGNGNIYVIIVVIFV